MSALSEHGLDRVVVVLKSGQYVYGNLESMGELFLKLTDMIDHGQKAACGLIRLDAIAMIYSDESGGDGR